jgi:transposase InsO family protein
MTFKIIHQYRFEFPVVEMCRILSVSRSGYYAWLRKPKSNRYKANEKLLARIKSIHTQSRGLYGSPRITLKLRSEGVKCSRNRVARLMKENHIAAITKRKFKATTNSKHNLPVADNVLNQQFAVDQPYKVWVSDITYVATDEGWLYLAAILDLYNREIVGWADRSTACHYCAKTSYSKTSVANWHNSSFR